MTYATVSPSALGAEVSGKKWSFQETRRTRRARRRRQLTDDGAMNALYIAYTVPDIWWMMSSGACRAVDVAHHALHEVDLHAAGDGHAFSAGAAFAQRFRYPSTMMIRLSGHATFSPDALPTTH